MVVVAVRDQDHVNARERLEGHSGCGCALGTREPDGAGALRPDRIHEDVQARDLNQNRGVPDHRDRDFRYALLRTGFLAGHAPRPLPLPAAQTPAQQVLQRPIRRCLARIEETDAVKVVAWRPLIVRVGDDSTCAQIACLQAALPTEPPRLRSNASAPASISLPAFLGPERSTGLNSFPLRRL